MTQAGRQRPGLRMHPMDASRWPDLQVVVGERGMGHRCQCQRYRLGDGEGFSSVPRDELEGRLRAQTGSDDSGSDGTAGIIAYDGDEPVGWCAVAPRSDLSGLRRFTVPWSGREERVDDASVWAISCVLVRAGRRRRGISHALAAAAVEHARAGGASAVEGYPTIVAGTLDVDRHVGTEAAFAAAGMQVVARPTKRRLVMRLDLSPADLPSQPHPPDPAG